MRIFSALPVLVLAALAIVISVQAIGCSDDCTRTARGATQCD